MLTLRDDRYETVRLTFEEKGHKYYDSFGNTYKSTTTFLHDYKKEFDRAYWLKKKAAELKISEKKLAQRWQDITDEACERGSVTHNRIEDGIKDVSKFKQAVQYLNRGEGEMITIADLPNLNYKIVEFSLKDFIEKTENRYPKIYEILAYYISQGYKLYAEIGAFLIDWLISGTIDLLIIRDDQFVIGDWKTNRGGLKFESGYFKKDKTVKPAQMTDIWVPKNDTLLAPVAHMPECNGSIYNLQLSMYAFMVEWILGIRNAGLWLAHIDSDFVLNDYGQPKMFNDGMYRIKDNPEEKVTIHKMPYRKTEIRNLLQDRNRVISASRNQTLKLF